MREGLGKFILGFFLALQFSFLSGQEITVKGGFYEDSLLIGKDVNFWITASYPAELEMVFPDSLSSFAPFEFSGKAFFPTELRAGNAFDSTVYRLQSFEIDKVQYLQLNAVVLQGSDSMVIKTPLDSIVLTELAPMVSDTTNLKENLAFQDIGTQFNYPLLYYVVAGLIILAVILLLIFGKRIVKWIKLKRLRKQYEIFSAEYDAFIKRLKVDPDPELAEQLLSTWKKYQQKLDKELFTVMSSKEILQLGYTKELELPLKSIDRVVYGRRIQENVYQDFLQLEDYTLDRYSKKIEEIKNGK